MKNSGFYSLLLLLSVMSSSFEQEQKISFGDACSKDKDCTGSNEYCEFNDAVIPPCKMGRCSCKGCHVFNAVTGCTHNATVIKPGQNCTGQANELLGEAAECVNKTVRCKPGFSVLDDKCGVAESCATGHSCGIGSCVNATCICNTNTSQSVQASYFVEEVSAFNANRTLCIHKDAKTVNVTALQTCAMDPASNANSNETTICSHGLFCYQCPEDRNISKLQGTCRKLNMTAARKEFTCLIDEAGEDAPRSLVPDEDKSPAFNEVCHNIFQSCKGDHVECQLHSQFTPACKRGYCECEDCFQRVGNKCVKKRFLNEIGEKCTGAPEEVIKVRRGTCLSGRVSCEAGSTMIEDRYGRKQCFANLVCDAKAGKPCANKDMTCDKDNKCICNVGYKFNEELQICIAREYGDSCRIDADCNQRDAGLNANGSIIGYTRYNTGSCRKGENRCVCGLGYKAAVVGFISPHTNDFDTKTVCVPATWAIDQRNGTCAVDPVKGDPYSPNSIQTVCSSTHICFSCELDGDFQLRGQCREVLKSFVTTDQDCSANRPMESSLSVCIVVSLVSTFFKYLL